jgi:hypothetical protein
VDILAQGIPLLGLPDEADARRRQAEELAHEELEPVDVHRAGDALGPLPPAGDVEGERDEPRAEGVLPARGAGRPGADDVRGAVQGAQLGIPRVVCQDGRLRARGGGGELPADLGEIVELGIGALRGCDPGEVEGREGGDPRGDLDEGLVGGEAGEGRVLGYAEGRQGREEAGEAGDFGQGGDAAVREVEGANVSEDREVGGIGVLRGQRVRAKREGCQSWDGGQRMD